MLRERYRMEKEKAERLTALAKNEVGEYLKTQRNVRGYLQNEVCGGICSTATLSRIEKGKKAADFLMIEAFLSRMKIVRTECEFVLDGEDYEAYKRRAEIEVLVKSRDYKQALKNMAAYKKLYGAEKLQDQFLSYQQALLERSIPGWKRENVRALFLKALTATAPEYRQKFRQREILSNLELSCITELIYCVEDPARQEEEYEELYAYFKWSCRREGFFPLAYRTAMQYYGKCLYKNRKYESCIRICDEALQELFRTSKAENRDRLFLLRAKAREEKGINTEEVYLVYKYPCPAIRLS